MYYKKPNDILAIINASRKNLLEPLTFTALSSDCFLGFLAEVEDGAPIVEYSFDRLEWNPFPKATEDTSSVFDLAINVPEGQSIYCRGNNPQGFPSALGGVCKFGAVGQWNVSGNIMTLIDYTNPPTEMVGTFSYLFGYLDTSEIYAVVDIIDASKLILPALKLTEMCYLGMFQNCVNLVKAPKLPAKESESLCYARMFFNCAKLQYINMNLENWGNNSTLEWLTNVSPTGTFSKPRQLSDLRGESYIPATWTIINK